MTPWFITVYVLNKNYGMFIEQCIESLLSQTNQNFELIIIDNCSDDNSHEILKTNYNYLTPLFLETPLKLTEVGNMVASISKGTHFVRLDADDWVCDEFIESLYEKLNYNTEIAALFPNYHEVDIDGNLLKTVKRFDFDSEVSLFDLPAHGACTLISKKVFSEIGGYDNSLDRQDGYDLWLKIIRNYKVTNIVKPLFFYRQHNLNLTKSQKKLLEVRTEILYKQSLQNGLDMGSCMYIISIQKHNDFFGELSNMQYGMTTILNNLIQKIFTINLDATVCISSESSKEFFQIDRHNVYFYQREQSNQSLKDALHDTAKYVTNLMHKDFTYIVSLTIDYPFLDAHYILAAIAYINFFDTHSVDSVCIEDSLLYKHTGHTLTPVYNNTVTRFERDTLYKKAGGINVIRLDKFDEYDGISTQKTGHIIVDKLSALRADSSEIISLLRKGQI